MKESLCKTLLGVGFVLCLLPAPAGNALPAQNNDDVLLSTMRQELQRARENLGKLDPAPHFLSYSVYDDSQAVAVGSEGSLINSAHVHQRYAGVVMRVGTPALDNSHLENRASAITAGLIPLTDDRNAVARALWQLTYGEYRKASSAFLNVKTASQVHAQEEDLSPDFSRETPQTHFNYGPPIAAPDQPALETLVRRCSAAFRKYPYIYSSMAIVNAEQTRFDYVSSEGSEVVTPQPNGPPRHSGRDEGG